MDVYRFIKKNLLEIVNVQTLLKHNYSKHGLVISDCLSVFYIILYAPVHYQWSGDFLRTEPLQWRALTNPPPGQMAAISQTTFSLKLVPGSPVNNIPALAQLVALRRSDVKTLSEPMLTQFTDAYMRN